MKKVVFCLSFASMLLAACGGNNEVKEVETVKEEVKSVDSVAVKMHNATEDIEKSSSELDELLNDI